MTISLAQEVEIRRLYFAEHWKRGTIVAQLGVHADVVERVLGRPGRHPKTAVARIAPEIEPYAGFLDETLERYPKLVGTRLYDMIRERGYLGSLRTLWRHLREARPTARHEAFLRLSPLIGEQGQIDWGHVGYLQVQGGRRPLYIFAMVLAYSRALWAELVLDLSAYSLRRSLVRAAVYFGGCTRQWLFDNPKIVVIERQGDAVRFHPMLLELCGAMHTQPRLCGVRKPQEKGRVERAIRFLKERFFAARRIHDVASGNAMLLEFLATVAGDRAHPEQPDRRVREVLEEERSKLLPLPPVLPSIDLVEPVTADKTAFVRFDDNDYSVPSAFARQTLTLHADDRVVRLLRGTEQVALHDRAWGHRQRIEDLAHRAELLQHKKAGQSSKSRDRLRAEVAGVESLFARWVYSGRNVASMTTRTAKLLDLYGVTLLQQAVAQALDKGHYDPGALAVLCEQARVAAARPIPVSLEFAQHVRDREVLPHDLGGYDE